jgi:hypothetical protein
MKQVKLKSGMGWQGFLRENYESFAEFQAFSESYNLHERLGYTTPKAAWDDNPIVQGSTNPKDYSIVRPNGRKRGKLWGDAEALSLDVYQTVCGECPKQSVLRRLEKKLGQLQIAIKLLQQ